jgi:hypothetical protein
MSPVARNAIENYSTHLALNLLVEWISFYSQSGICTFRFYRSIIVAEVSPKRNEFCYTFIPVKRTRNNFKKYKIMAFSTFGLVDKTKLLKQDLVVIKSIGRPNGSKAIVMRYSSTIALLATTLVGAVSGQVSPLSRCRHENEHHRKKPNHLAWGSSSEEKLAAFNRWIKPKTPSPLAVFSPS